MTAGDPRPGAPGDEIAAGPGGAAGRAARMLRWYPRAWRDRYGAEFTELLMSDISERPHSLARTLDVARGGIVARLGQAGLAAIPFRQAESEPAGQQVTASLASLACALAVFLAFGAAMWSQLIIGWQWSTPFGADAPDGTPTLPRPAASATVVTSVMMLTLLAIALLAAVPVAVTVARRFAARRHDRLMAPAVAALAAVAVLFIGGRHFGNGWPGTGGHHGLVPGGLAAFEWATSLSVSAYWAHPGALAAFPAPELAWMFLSPLALIAAVAGAAVLIRRAGLSPRVLAFETRLAVAACAVMAVFLAACCDWIATGGQRSLFHAGLIDVAGTAVLGLAFAVAVQAARTASFRLRFARN